MTQPYQASELGAPLDERFRIVRKLASGGMGDVFLAYQLGPVAFNRLVVLKSLHPDLLGNGDFVAMFLNEAQIIANLTHPNIIHVYELLQDTTGYMLAMEYVRGGTVLDLLRIHRKLGLGGLPMGPALRIATSVCDALHYAYFERDADGQPRHVIHRDVSLSNILVGYDGHTKLVDFGIAKALASEPLTKATTIKGKSGYLAPEQITMQPLDHRCDIFALGIVVWEMTVGDRLFRRDNDLQTMHAILHDPIELPSARVPDYPRDLEAVVMRALARDRDDRYDDADQFGQALREVAHRHGWDLGADALGAVVRATLPEDESLEQDRRAALESSSYPTPSRSRTPSIPATSPTRAGRLAAGAVSAVSVAGAAAAPAAPTNWRLVAAMVLASALFWLFVVPAL
ncbi:MAG TPA: serine/threonine-protein kinase [Kofleriaceae bacterium]|nr:serine/threonine-protein kinase [Kofleriaceae bacterium]